MASKKSKVKKKSNKNKFNKQAFSIVLFSTGVLIAFLTIIKGGAFWRTIHSSLFGLFGVAAFFIAPIIIYTSVMIALDKEKDTIVTKLIESVILLLLVAAVVQVVFVGKIVGDGLVQKIKYVFDSGKNCKGGGVFSMFVAYPLLTLFHRTGATIIVLLLTITFAILLTDVSLIQIFKFISKPFRKNDNQLNCEEKSSNVSHVKKNK